MTTLDISFDNTFVRELGGLFEPWQATTSPAPELLVLNDELALELGLSPAELRTPAGIGVLVGNDVPPGAEPVAQAYSGHQFGGYSPRLGDGRALLIGELLDAAGARRDLHLKGSGRTPFARGGDGRAAVGPMLREFVIGEAMHGLGIPTTRALAVVATGEQVTRDTMLPGAVLARVASSHLRIGTFQYAASLDDPGLLRRLADYAIARHHPRVAASDNPYLSLFTSVLEAQASLVARWMLVGFIHGVMNTDNTTISGETIDYGPCAFMDAYDPATVFSSIDHGGRYAYGNQPQITQWNLARFAETLLPLIDDDVDRAIELATAALESFPDRYAAHSSAGMRAKLGLGEERDGDETLVGDLLTVLQAGQADFTGTFRALSTQVRGERSPTLDRLDAMDGFADWSQRWSERLGAEGRDPDEVARSMDGVNPVYIPRNHLVEAALDAATNGDLEPFRRLVDVVSSPFEERPGLEQFATPDPAGSESYQTFCGT